MQKKVILECTILNNSNTCYIKFVIPFFNDSKFSNTKATMQILIKFLHTSVPIMFSVVIKRDLTLFLSFI